MYFISFRMIYLNICIVFEICNSIEIRKSKKENEKKMSYEVKH